MKKLVVDYAPWDDGDYIVCIRPENVEAWNSAPVAPLLSKAKAEIVADWLNIAMPMIQKIVVQTEADPKV